MTTPVHCVCPLARPHLAAEVVCTWRRMARHGDRMVIVENGPGVGACGEDSPAMGFHVTRSAHGIGEAMNEGLRVLREVAAPGDWFAKIDDDDEYSQGYLDEIREAAYAAPPFAVIGKRDINASFDGRPAFVLWPHAEPTRCYVSGGSLAARVHEAAQFAEGVRWGEDAAFVDAMRARGGTVVVTPAEGYVYRRSSAASHDHAYPLELDDLRRYGATLLVDGRELGPLPMSLDVATHRFAMKGVAQ